MSKKQIITALTLLYIVVLTTLCLVQFSAPTPALQIIGFDKVVHFCFYFVLNTLLVSTIIARYNHVKTIQVVATTIASIAYGGIPNFIRTKDWEI